MTENITNLHKRLAPYYKVFRTTLMIDDDIKLLKKINVVLAKLERTNNDVYFLEVINIMKTLDNVLTLKYIQDIFIEIIDLKYQQFVLTLINDINKVTADKLRTIKVDFNYE
jgi:hypothetical protein